VEHGRDAIEQRFACFDVVRVDVTPSDCDTQCGA